MVCWTGELHSYCEIVLQEKILSAMIKCRILIRWKEKRKGYWLKNKEIRWCKRTKSIYSKQASIIMSKFNEVYSCWCSMQSHYLLDLALVKNNKNNITRFQHILLLLSNTKTCQLLSPNVLLKRWRENENIGIY